jgi:hypothetical protein
MTHRKSNPCALERSRVPSRVTLSGFFKRHEGLTEKPSFSAKVRVPVNFAENGDGGHFQAETNCRFSHQDRPRVAAPSCEV